MMMLIASLHLMELEILIPLLILFYLLVNEFLFVSRAHFVICARVRTRIK
jgi:hypothetical protein